MTKRTCPAGAAPILGRIGLVAILVCSTPVAADDDMALARRLHDAGKVLSLQDVLLRARAYHTGTLIDAQLVREAEHDGYVYEVLMLDEHGVIWEVEIDASTGVLVEHERHGD